MFVITRELSADCSGIVSLRDLFSRFWELSLILALSIFGELNPMNLDCLAFCTFSEMCDDITLSLWSSIICLLRRACLSHAEYSCDSLIFPEESHICILVWSPRCLYLLRSVGLTLRRFRYVLNDKFLLLVSVGLKTRFLKSFIIFGLQMRFLLLKNSLDCCVFLNVVLTLSFKFFLVSLKVINLICWFKLRGERIFFDFLHCTALFLVVYWKALISEF